jgi:hypothetical protein
MVRVRILMAAVLALASLALVAVPATAAVPAKNTKFCAAAQKISGDVGSNEVSGIKNLKALTASIKKAAKSAPKNVKAAMNTIAGYFSAAAKVGTDPSKAANLSKLGAKYTAAITTFTTYLATNCT